MGNWRMIEMSGTGDPHAVVRRQASKGRYIFPCPACHGTGDGCENCEGSGACFMTRYGAEDYYTADEIEAVIAKHEATVNVIR